MVGHTLILSNKKVSVKESVQKRVLLAFLKKKTLSKLWRIKLTHFFNGARS